MRESTRKYRDSDKEEHTDHKKQLLGFEDVNFEQRREPYNARTRDTSKSPQQYPKIQPEGRNRR